MKRRNIDILLSCVSSYKRLDIPLNEPWAFSLSATRPLGYHRYIAATAATKGASHCSSHPAMAGL